MSRRTLERRIAALGLAAMLALPGAALARPGRPADPGPSTLWTWLARLVVEITIPAGPRHADGSGRVNTWGKTGSTADPDGRRMTSFLVAEPPPAVPTDADSPAGTTF